MFPTTKNEKFPHERGRRAGSMCRTTTNASKRRSAPSPVKTTHPKNTPAASVSERLDDGDNPGFEGRPRHSLKIEEKRPDGTAAKIAQEPALELEEEPQHLGNREDHLAVRDIEKEYGTKGKNPGSYRKKPTNVPPGSEDSGCGQRFAVLMKRPSFMSANPQRGL